MNQFSKKRITSTGKRYLLDIAINSETLKNNLTFKEHVSLCNEIINLDYEGVATVFCEDVREFEGKFSKFLKYGLAGVAGAFLGLKTKGLKVGLMHAPPLAMFTLYLFRKAMDPCERLCFRKWPMSTKRAICKAECRVKAATDITHDLRSEIAKCRQFVNPKKCEKRLMKEYHKWAKKLQKELVKLRNIRAGQVDKIRKKRGREMERKAKSLAASHQINVGKMATIISESERLRETLSFKDHLYLYHAVIAEAGFRTPAEIYHDKGLAKCKKLAKGNKQKYDRCVGKLNKGMMDNF